MSAPELTPIAYSTPYGKTSGSLHRSLEILELFSVEQRPLTVSEVSERLGYPQSSTSVMLRYLSDLNYLVHDRRERSFFPTMRVTFVGMWLHQQALSRGNLLEFMEKLAHESGQVTMLALQNKLYAQYIHITSSRASRVGLKPGLLRPLCRSAVGKVLLSTMPDDKVLQVVRNVNAIDKDFPAPVDAQVLFEELRECRRTGFAYSRSEVTEGASTVARLVPVDIGGQPLAVGLGAHSEEFDQLLPMLQALLSNSIAEHFEGSAELPAVQRAIHGAYAVARNL